MCRGWCGNPAACRAVYAASKMSSPRWLCRPRPLRVAALPLLHRAAMAMGMAVAVVAVRPAVPVRPAAAAAAVAVVVMEVMVVGGRGRRIADTEAIDRNKAAAMEVQHQRDGVVCFTQLPPLCAPGVDLPHRLTTNPINSSSTGGSKRRGEGRREEILNLGGFAAIFGQLCITRYQDSAIILTCLWRRCSYSVGLYGMVIVGGLHVQFVVTPSLSPPFYCCIRPRCRGTVSLGNAPQPKSNLAPTSAPKTHRWGAIRLPCSSRPVRATALFFHAALARGYLHPATTTVGVYIEQHTAPGHRLAATWPRVQRGGVRCGCWQRRVQHADAARRQPHQRCD